MELWLLKPSEILPDTRITHGDKLTEEENFSNAAGAMAILHYRVNHGLEPRH